jgi:hypothetical protein
MMTTTTTTTTKNTVDDADHVGAIGLSIWMVSLCAFVFANDFTGPWPQSIYDTVPERIWFLGHVIGGMLFGGGVIVTTYAEWLVVRSKDLEVMTFSEHATVRCVDCFAWIESIDFVRNRPDDDPLRWTKLRAAAYYLRLMDVTSICSVAGIHRSYNAR